MTTHDRFCIIGAGPSGLATARAFAQAGIPFDVLERHADVGGIWDIENERTPMYESAHFISSRTQSAFDDFPMPEHYADYPGHREILAYIRAFADHYGLRDHITFETTVDRVTPAGDAWDVHLASGEVRRYRGVVCAVGHNWDPIVPIYPGRFDAESYHSFYYKSPAELVGKRVLVVGAGNSGCDIACDAAANADRAFISMRRGYYFLPKHIFGQPTDAFFRSGPHLPAWLAQPLLTALLRILVGDLRRYGLPKPDHKVLESHPIVSSQLLHYLAHGDVTAKPDVRELCGTTVRFADGSEEPIDLIIYATGYRATIPCLDPSVLSLEAGAAPLLLNVFPDRKNLFVVGLFETDGGAYPMVSRQAALIATLIRAEERAPAAARWFHELRTGPRPNLTGGIKYLASPRHSIYVQYDEYMHYTAKVLKKLERAVGAPSAPTPTARSSERRTTHDAPALVKGS
ncbi:MAG: NAD(P)-binding domain-containing protein [Gemmatimonadaceae bacterium]|nr:NAD(P)-binding domain-containing protein [Gemmatimonadaceae bacterium]